MRLVKKALLLAGLAAAAMAGSAHAAVTFDVSQRGADVVVTARGTFDRSLATSTRTSPFFFTGVNSATGFLASGASGPIDLFYDITGPMRFGFGGDGEHSSASGTAIGIYAGAPSFFISRDYVSNAPITSSATIADATLASLGFQLGSYAFTVGGNALTVDIGQAAAVPEPASWALLIFGLGVVGAGLRRRATPSVRFA